MCDEIFEIDNISQLDKHLYKLILFSSDNINKFLKYYSTWSKIENIKQKDIYEQYIVNYGYMLFCKLSYKKIYTFSNDIIEQIIDLLDFIYKKGSERVKKDIFKVFENGLLSVHEQYWNWNIIYRIIRYEPLLNYFITFNHNNPVDFEKCKFLGKILSIDKTNGEKNENLETVRNNQLEIREHIFNIFTFIHKNDSITLFSIFNSIAIFNAPKGLITTHTYYADYLNTYHFLETCLSIILLLNKEYTKNNVVINCKYIYNQNCTIYRYNTTNINGETIQSDSDEYNNETKWHFLLYSYYKIVFYSLITQNYNCILQNAISVSNPTQLILKKYIELNNVYINEPYNSMEIHSFMHHFIENLDCNLATDDIIHEILQYYHYIMEHNKLFTMTNIDYLPISFFKKIIMDNEIFKNPYLKLKCTKLIFLYELNYGKLDLGENFLNSLVKLSIHIHKLPGMDQYNERIFYQSNITKIFIQKQFVTTNKELFIVLFTEFDNVLSNKMQELRNLILNSSSLEFNTLNFYYKNLDVYLGHIKNFISYIELCFWSDNGPFTNVNVDISYHFCKFMYCIFKNMFDKNSTIIKINYNISNNNMNFWHLFKNHILHLFVYQFDAVFKLPNVIIILNRFYPDIQEYIGMFDIEFDTSYLEKYNKNVELLLQPEFPNNLPEEFLDPLLFTPIIEPMILPESGIIIDKTVIMSHLLENNYDPFNRQPLTFEHLENFNLLDNIKEKSIEFICKRDLWIKNNITNNK
jgi:hypothetical protein